MGAGKWQVSAGGGHSPTWAPDGRTLYFLNGRNLMAAAIATGPTFTRGTPEAVLDRADYAFPGSARQYAVAPDGRFLLIKNAAVDGDGAPLQITVILHWAEELKRLVPTAP